MHRAAGSPANSSSIDMTCTEQRLANELQISHVKLCIMQLAEVWESMGRATTMHLAY